MQNITRIVICFTLFNLISSALNAQTIVFPRGYYINQKGKKTTGFFDMELFQENKITLKNSQDDAGQVLEIEDVVKIVLEKAAKDSTLIFVEKLSFNGQEEKVYIEYILRGGVNLLHGYSKNEKEIFFITSTALPTLRRINKSDPKTFFFTYFPKCADLKSQISEIYYDRGSLEQAILLFAKCSKAKISKVGRPKPIEFVKYEFERHFSVGVKALSGYWHAKTNNYYDAQFKAITPHGFGANVQLSVTNRFSISAELNYTSNTLSVSDSIRLWLQGAYESRFYYTSFPKITYNRLEIVPIELKYVFSKLNRKIQPVVSSGLIFNKITNPKLEGGQFGKYKAFMLNPAFPPRFTVDNPPVPAVLGDLIGDAGGFGIFVTAAAQWQVNKSVAFGLGLKYTLSRERMYLGNTNGILTDDNFFSNIQRLDAFAHLLFTIK